MKKLKLFLTLLTLVIFGSGQMWGGVSGTYNLASSVSAGDVIIIVNADNTYALKSLTTGNKPYGDYSSVTCTDGVITLSNANVEELNVVTGNANGSFSFQGTAAISGYLNHSGSNNTLNSNAQKSNNTSWTIAIDATSKDATIANVATTTRVMRFNTNSGQERFACYTSATGTLVHIFKKQVASCSDNPIVGNIMNNVSSITASGATFTTSAGVSAGTNCTLSEVGFVYGTSAEPTITSGTKAVIANYESGNLSKAVTGLTEGTHYYVRAYATNGHGTAYSDEKEFDTPELAKYTVSFITGAGNSAVASKTEASVGAGITLPGGPASIKASGWTFAGWAESAVDEETTTEPTLLTGTYHPTHDCSLYAVYRKTSDEYTTKTVDLVANAGTFSTDHITFSALNGTLTLTQIKATASSDVNGTYKEKGTDSNRPRVYKGQSLKIESTNYMISKVEITANSTKYGNDITAATSIESDGSVTDDTDAITKTLAYSSGGTHTFTVVDEDGVSGVYIQNTAATTNVQLHLNNVVVSYLVAEVIYYSTPCQKLPTITPSVQDATQSGITVKWTNSSDVTTWNVQYKVQGAGDNTYADVTTSSKTTSDGFNLWTVTGLNAGTTYTFKIEATAFGAGVCTDVNTWTIDGATENNYVVTVESNNDNWGTAELSGSTITATPVDGYRVSQETPYTVSVANAVDVAQDGNVFTISNLSNSCTITINFEAIPTYAVNWYVNGTSQKNLTYREGTLVSTIMADAPSVLDNALNASCGSTKFIGWVTAEYTANDGTVNTYNSSKVDGEATLSAAANYYAMFATATTDEWSRVETLGGITAGTYVIVSQAANEDYYMLPSATNTSTAQPVSDDYKVTRNNDGSKITSDVPTGAEWSFTINNQGKYIIKNAEDKNLYATSANNGLRVGATEDTWTISVNGSAPAYLMTESNNTRCCGIYSSQDWRSYANTEQGLNNYPDGGKVYLYKHTAIYGEYRTGCTCNTVTVAIGTHTNGTLKLDGGDANVSHETCTASSVEVRVAPNATYQFAATNAVTFNMGTTGLTAPSSYEPDGDARVYTVSIPKGTAAGTITVSASFESLPKYGINLSGVSHLTNLASSPATEALGGETVTLSYDDVEDGYTFLNWIVKGATTNNTIPVTNNQFQMPNDEGVVVTADIRENVSVAFYVGTTPYGDAAVTYTGGTISLPATDPTESFDATNYPNFIGWSATNFGAVTEAPALVDGSETINASTSYYAVFANEATAGTNNYQKIDYTATLSGNYIIAAYASSTYKAMRAEKGQYNLNSTTVTVDENVINNEDALLVWNITQDANTNYVKLKNGSNWATIVYDGSQYTNLILTTTDAANQFTIAENNAAEDAYVFTTTESIDRNEIEYHNGFTAYNGQDAPIYLFKQVLAPTKWATKQIAEVTVSFNDNVAEEEITVPGNQVVDSGDDLDLSGFTPGARAGYQFAGWSLTTDGAVVASLSNITENTPLYAIWTANPNCTIKFSVRETVKDALQETILQGQTFSGFASKEIAEADEVDGYDFIGWASAAQLAETTDVITPMTSYTPEVEESASEITVYALYKRVTDAAEKVDHLDRAFTGRPSTSSYGDWSSKKGSSDAVYAGNSAGDHDAIQLRSGNNSAIVTTTSAGKATKVVLTWNYNTTSGRTVDVYGKNTAYEDASSLYSAAGTKIGSIVEGTSTELTISGEYAYIGLRSNSGALYLDEIAITWSSSTTYYTTRPTQLWAVEYDLDGGEWKSGEGCADGTVQEGEYTVCTDVPVNGDDKLFDKWQMNGVDVTTATVNITEATTFTAVWKDRGHGTVTYSANGGTTSGDVPAAENVWEGEKVTVVANTFFSKPGFDFDGWLIVYNDGVSDQEITPENGEFEMVAYNVTIKAKWAEETKQKWALVTDVEDLKAGDKYIIAAAGYDYAMAAQKSNNRDVTSVVKRDDGALLKGTSSMQVITLEGSTGVWEFNTGAGYLYAAASGSNHLKTQATNDINGKWAITFENGVTSIVASGSSNRNVMQFNNGSPKLFSCYGSASEKAVALYKEIPVTVIDDNNKDQDDVPDGGDMTINENMTWTVTEDKEVGDVYMKEGAIIANSAKVEANDLYFKTQKGKSNQIVDASQLNVIGDLYYDVQLCDGDLDADYWYSIAVPFDVDLNSGVFQADGSKMTNRVDFEVWGFSTQLRAQTQSNGWQRVSDNTMHAGKAYLIGFNAGQTNIIRLKAAPGWKQSLFSGNSMSVVNSGSGDHDNWNGLANPTMRYIDVNKDAQAFNNNTHRWDSYALDADRYNFVVGTAFFVQSASAVTISNTDHGNYRAPKRESENKCAYAVRITRDEADEFDNQIIVRASEDATGEYTQGHDMLTMNNTTAPSAMLWTENYGGKRLAIEEAAWLNGTASYVLKMYAPKAGTYSISVASVKENADLYLTYEGAIIWNLSMGAYEISLNKGTTSGYGLLLQAKAPGVATGVDEIGSEKAGVQKIVLEDKVFILRGGKMYDVTGKAVR